MPPTKGHEAAEPIPVTGIHLWEPHPPQGEKPLEWFLLTSLAVDSGEQAAELVQFYLQRWRIEDFFRVLKTGCQSESLELRTAVRRQRAITINTLIAWRLMVMTQLGRQVPEGDPKVIFSRRELTVLQEFAQEVKEQPPLTIQQAVLLVAMMGGYQNRKHDPEPGNEIRWRGLSPINRNREGTGDGTPPGPSTTQGISGQVSRLQWLLSAEKETINREARTHRKTSAMATGNRIAY